MHPESKVLAITDKRKYRLSAMMKWANRCLEFGEERILARHWGTRSKSGINKRGTERRANRSVASKRVYGLKKLRLN